eukprot:2450361-Prymnesium_polylepis.1
MKEGRSLWTTSDEPCESSLRPAGIDHTELPREKGRSGRRHERGQRTRVWRVEQGECARVSDGPSADCAGGKARKEGRNGAARRGGCDGDACATGCGAPGG